MVKKIPDAKPEFFLVLRFLASRYSLREESKRFLSFFRLFGSESNQPLGGILSNVITMKGVKNVSQEKDEKKSRHHSPTFARNFCKLRVAFSCVVVLCATSLAYSAFERVRSSTERRQEKAISPVQSARVNVG